jgi:pyruvate/2-oxoacid:ferredoxin oxidoreductase beta subunit
LRASVAGIFQGDTCFLDVIEGHGAGMRDLHLLVTFSCDQHDVAGSGFRDRQSDGLAAIGLQALSGAAERNEDFIYICNDNEGYMNTGTQRSSATPLFAWTTTTPVTKPKENPKKDIMAIMADHQIPYAATATIAYPEDLLRKVEKARSIRGTRFIHLLSPCSPGWKIPSELTIKVSRLAVRSRVFPLYEIENGISYMIREEPRVVPVKEYLKLQGRFSHLTDSEIDMLQENVERTWERLLRKAQA